MAKALTSTSLIAVLLAAIEHVRAEYQDDRKLTPAEILDVLLGILGNIQSSLPAPLPTFIQTVINIGRSVLGILGEEPGPDQVRMATDRIEAVQIATSSVGRVGTRERLNYPRTEPLPKSAQRNEQAK